MYGEQYGDYEYWCLSIRGETPGSNILYVFFFLFQIIFPVLQNVK